MLSLICLNMCLETMDFSSMTLTQIKRQEMDAQVTLSKNDTLGKIQTEI